MRDRDPEFEHWVQRARDTPILDVAAMLGAQMRRAGAGEQVGPCPKCGGTDRFQVKGKDGVFLCRGSDGKGDGIAMVQHVRGLEFVQACELILNEPPPRSDSKVEPKPIDHQAERIEHERRQDREISDAERDRADKSRKSGRAQQVFESGKPISGTWVARCLAARGLKPLREQAQFLRFLPEYPYYEGEDEHGKPKIVGRWHAQAALMRDKAGVGTSLHLTYFDNDRPAKIDVTIEGVDGRPLRLNPRKMYGPKGLIWLSPIRPIMVIGEGIETVLSWYELHPDIADIGIAAAGDLGNLAGYPTEWVPHPTLRKRVIPNGIPDPSKPGMPVPDEVKEIIFLGDADKDDANTRAHLLLACRRHQALGRKCSVHMAPLPDGQKKWDWNDELRAHRSRDASPAPVTA